MRNLNTLWVEWKTEYNFAHTAWNNLRFKKKFFLSNDCISHDCVFHCLPFTFSINVILFILTRVFAHAARYRLTLSAWREKKKVSHSSKCFNSNQTLSYVYHWQNVCDTLCMLTKHSPELRNQFSRFFFVANGVTIPGFCV